MVTSAAPSCARATSNPPAGAAASRTTATRRGRDAGRMAPSCDGSARVESAGGGRGSAAQRESAARVADRGRALETAGGARKHGIEGRPQRGAKLGLAACRRRSGGVGAGRDQRAAEGAAERAQQRVRGDPDGAAVVV